MKERVERRGQSTTKLDLKLGIMKNLLLFALLGALLAVTLAEEFEEIDGEEDLLMNDEEFDGSGTGPSIWQCKKDLWKCVKAATSWEERRACFKPKYYQCIKDSLPTLPPHVKQCHEEKSQCLGAADGWRDRLKCGKDYLKCLWNRP